MMETIVAQKASSKTVRGSAFLKPLWETEFVTWNWVVMGKDGMAEIVLPVPRVSSCLAMAPFV